ncbi:CRISPR-associated endonuclease Cas2 [Crossiella sp. SN42]|uniref:CRISPR-associated endonuclease Cas2 n=1 Tax=Crossiella sp. SN42 TaxID=2944808 RepID=UPI00207D38B1|nr:CRISPR-associated endonuclease Cas2 [Crossiella sp. SN42]MCO1575119.1 CRISPR-associated endonuclease Cas2 [Crossiella sp. SN42]
MMVLEWLVTFDVPGDRPRRALTRVLEALGPRVAHSVFLLPATPSGIDQLLTRTADLLVGGHLLALPSCPRCRVVVLGRDLEELPDSAWIAW